MLDEKTANLIFALITGRSAFGWNRSNPKKSKSQMWEFKQGVEYFVVILTKSGIDKVIEDCENLIKGYRR